MLKRKQLALLAVSLCACDHTITAPTVQTDQPDFATISLSAAIDGDASLFGGYLAVVDGSTAQSLSAGAASSVIVRPGEHTVEIRRSVITGGGAGGTAPWCAPLLPTSKTVIVSGGGEAALTFGFHCEPLNGRGLLRLNIGASGTSAPSQVNVILRAGLIFRTDHVVPVPTNQTTDLLIGPNIYQLGVDAPSCPLPNGPFSILPSGFVVQPDKVLYFSFSLTCH
jgi:hypothetical protein